MTRKNEALPEKGNKRRDFLKMAALSAPAAVAVAGSVGAAEADTVIDAGSDKIRDTAHTRAYYDSARF